MKSFNHPCRISFGTEIRSMKKQRVRICTSGLNSCCDTETYRNNMKQSNSFQHPSNHAPIGVCQFPTHLAVDRCVPKCWTPRRYSDWNTGYASIDHYRIYNKYARFLFNEWSLMIWPLAFWFINHKVDGFKFDRLTYLSSKQKMTHISLPWFIHLGGHQPLTSTRPRSTE